MNTQQIINRLDDIFELIDQAWGEQDTIKQLKQKSDSKDSVNAYSGYGYEYNTPKRAINSHLETLEELLSMAFDEAKQLLEDLRSEGNE